VLSKKWLLEMLMTQRADADTRQEEEQKKTKTPKIKEARRGATIFIVINVSRFVLF